MIPRQGKLAYLAFLAYLAYLAYRVIIAKEVKIVKEVISCDVSSVAMFCPPLYLAAPDCNWLYPAVLGSALVCFRSPRVVLNI